MFALDLIIAPPTFIIFSKISEIQPFHHSWIIHFLVGVPQEIETKVREVFIIKSRRRPLLLSHYDKHGKLTVADANTITDGRGLLRDCKT